MVSSERGPAETRSTDSKSRRRRDRDRRWAILQAQARSYVLKRLLWHRPRDDVAGATGPDPLWYTGSKPGGTAPSDVDNGTDSIKWVDKGIGSGWSPIGVTTNTESGGPHNIILACHTRSKFTDTVKLREIMFTRKTFFFDGRTVIWFRLFAWRRALST